MDKNSLSWSVVWQWVIGLFLTLLAEAIVNESFLQAYCTTINFPCGILRALIFGVLLITITALVHAVWIVVTRKTDESSALDFPVIEIEGKPYIKKRSLNMSLHSVPFGGSSGAGERIIPIFVPVAFVQINISNHPKTINAESTAKNVIARITYLKTDNTVIKSVSGRWAGDGGSKDEEIIELLSNGKPRVLYLAMKYDEDYDNDLYMYSMETTTTYFFNRHEDDTYKINEKEIIVKVEIIGERVQLSREFILHNEGKTLQIEMLNETESESIEQKPKTVKTTKVQIHPREEFPRADEDGYYYACIEIDNGEDKDLLDCYANLITLKIKDKGSGEWLDCLDWVTRNTNELTWPNFDSAKDKKRVRRKNKERVNVAKWKEGKHPIFIFADGTEKDISEKSFYIEITLNGEIELNEKPTPFEEIQIHGFLKLKRHSYTMSDEPSKELYRYRLYIQPGELKDEKKPLN